MTGPWWQGAVFYEVYVRSFADSNDDGIGDLPGITSRLDYLERLGVDAVWLTPFYPSPQKDHGYDVADYCDVNPDYGTLEDFDRLIERAHALGLRVLVDLVPNHTSDQHPWFQAALSSPDDPHRALYHFAPAPADGSPPNNWHSAFGGSAWGRDERSGEWYLHLFAPEQPDLNWWNPQVPAEFERILKFWLDRGADGYRIDVASALFKRRDLADTPTIRDPGFHITDQPQVHDVYRSWRRIADEYEPHRVLVGEIFESQRQRRYIVPDQLHLAFALIPVRWEAASWRRLIDVDVHALRGPGVAPTWMLSNHDVVRHVTRFGGGSSGRDRARAALLLLLGLPGQVVVYQGEELGLEEVDLAPEARQDPVFIHTHGLQAGRDGCRVPLPWARDLPNAGFSSAEPWLPMPPGWDRFAAGAEESSGSSMLTFYKRALALRRRLARWLPPVIGWMPAPSGVLVYRRKRLSVACNFLSRAVRTQVRGRLVLASAPLAKLKNGWLTLPPNSAVWIDSAGAR
jgi:alpha-glucosidase